LKTPGAAGRRANDDGGIFTGGERRDFFKQAAKNQLQGRRYQDENEAIFLKIFSFLSFFKKIVDIYGPRFLATTKGLTH
jgi:hypothetical protein